jgi:hypothetical protein
VKVKQYTKNWMMAFTISLLVCACFVLAFMLYLNSQGGGAEEQPAPSRSEADEQSAKEEFTDIPDNVGAVSFTEDQITELARNIFSLDGFLNNVSVELKSDGEIKVGAKIKDKSALLKQYPELEKYSLLLSAVEHRNIEVTGGLSDNGGMAAFEIESVTVAGVPIDKGLISPFIEEDDFSELFSVEYDSVEVDDGLLVFKNGVPDILKY